MRHIPASGINLFQLIYVFCREYTAKTGLAPMNLSLGNPDTVPDAAILELQARCAADPAFDFHTYAEESNLLRFVEGMVELHSGVSLADEPHLRAVPIAGIKTATAFLPLACGLHLGGARRRASLCVVSNLPAYDVVDTWSKDYLGARRVAWPLVSVDRMRLNLPRLREALKKAKVAKPDLVFVIRPGNPAAVGASEGEWKELIRFCIRSKARLVNDAAYVGLADNSHIALASVAKEHPELEWAEMYSVSKSFSDPGARLGAIVGSKDFIEDFVLIKGNSDSGPVPYLMAAYGKFFEDMARARLCVEKLRAMYRKRLDYVVPAFRKAGLREACRTEAGFFTLWKVPRMVLGAELAKDPRTKGLPPHEAFNRLVIEETGIVGVHFMGTAAEGSPEPLIRYAVCADVLDPSFQSRFEEQLTRLKPEY
ncbi:MAG: pyridoxal phosphate-dependent aminotransferase [Elusimicrobia bacterium]|nr:pyridoxal phosphate-dependent aminotransferase [Elusimicrobiota bacterium]